MQSRIYKQWSRFSTAALLSLCVLATAPRALAHAVLQKSSPAAKSAISSKEAAALPIMLTFNSRIDAAHSMLSLVQTAGAKPITLTVDTKAEPNILRSTATGLKPGHYQLQWQVVASDGHMSRGVIPFDVH